MVNTALIIQVYYIHEKHPQNTLAKVTKKQVLGNDDKYNGNDSKNPSGRRNNVFIFSRPFLAIIFHHM